MSEAKKRILVADDDEDVRIIVAKILRGTGFEVETAVTGREALDKLSEKRPDLLILDLMMPEVDGWEVLEEIKDHEPPPVVVLTARDDYDSFARAVRAGAAAHLVKPFRFQELVATCHSILISGAKPKRANRERRRNQRRGLLVEIQVLSRDKAPLAVGELVDISHGGAQVHLQVRLDVGAHVRLAYRPPGGGGALLLEGLVKWCEPKDHGHALGLSFSEMSPQLESALRNLLGETD